MFPPLPRSECVWTVRAIRDWTNVSAEQKGPWCQMDKLRVLKSRKFSLSAVLSCFYVVSFIAVLWLCWFLMNWSIRDYVLQQMPPVIGGKTWNMSSNGLSGSSSHCMDFGQIYSMSSIKAVHSGTGQSAHFTLSLCFFYNVIWRQLNLDWYCRYKIHINTVHRLQGVSSP